MKCGVILLFHWKFGNDLWIFEKNLVQKCGQVHQKQTFRMVGAWTWARCHQFSKPTVWKHRTELNAPTSSILDSLADSGKYLSYCSHRHKLLYGCAARAPPLFKLQGFQASELPHFFHMERLLWSCLLWCTKQEMTPKWHSWHSDHQFRSNPAIEYNFSFKTRTWGTFALPLDVWSSESFQLQGALPQTTVIGSRSVLTMIRAPPLFSPSLCLWIYDCSHG